LPPSRAIAAQCPAGQWLRIRTILTDNGKGFTDRLFGLRKRAATGGHEFDTLCAALDIDHRLVRGRARSGLKRSAGAFPRRPSPPPKSPQTNGMVPSHGLKANHCRAMERFNGRIEEVLQSHHFRSGEDLETTLHRYVWLYNQQLPQSALGSTTPLQVMKDGHKLKPELFKKQPYCLPGCDR
jgi:hypothetical protein